MFIGHDLRGHTNEVHANELRRRQGQSTATDRALLETTNVVQQTASQAKQQAATGQLCVRSLAFEPSALSSCMVQVYSPAWLVSSVKNPSRVAWLKMVIAAR